MRVRWTITATSTVYAERQPIVHRNRRRNRQPRLLECPSLAGLLAQLQEEVLQGRFGLFIHFGMATFHDMQWATGHERPVAPDLCRAPEGGWQVAQGLGLARWRVE